MALSTQFNTPKRVTAAFAGALVVFGVAFYAVKQNIAKKRKAELYEYRASVAQGQELRDRRE